MIRYISAILFALVVTPVFAAGTVTNEKEIAIVHFDKLKEAKLDGNAKDLKLQPMIGADWQTPYFRIANSLTTPREVIVQIQGLTENDYDLYIFDTKNHGNLKMVTRDNIPNKPVYLDPKIYFAGKKSRIELESGINIPFSGTFISTEYRDYFQQMRTRCQARDSFYLEPKVNDETDVCKVVLKAIPQWLTSLEAGDQRMRSVGIVVVPVGQTLVLPGGGVTAQSPDFNAAVLTMGKTIQSARRDIVKLVKNAMYQSDALEALTPVDMKITVYKPVAKTGITLVHVNLRNWTDREITGTVNLFVPQGYTVKQITPVIKLSPFSRDAEAKFEVIAPKTVKTITSMSAQADLTIEDVQLKLQVKTEK